MSEKTKTTKKSDGKAPSYIAYQVRNRDGEKGFDPVYGARPLKRVIQSAVLNPLARMLLEHKVVNGDKVKIALKGDSLTFKVA